MQKGKKPKVFNIFPFQGQNSTAVHTKPIRRRAMWGDVLWLASCAGSLWPGANCKERWWGVCCAVPLTMLLTSPSTLL